MREIVLKDDVKRRKVSESFAQDVTERRGTPVSDSITRGEHDDGLRRLDEAGIETRMVMEDTAEGGHAVVRILATGDIIDPQTPDGHEWIAGTVISEISYEDAEWIATTRGQ
jgi:hypothetical protein